MTRQFRSELSVWTEFGQFLMRRGKLEAARRLLQRCLKTLPLKQQRKCPPATVSASIPPSLLTLKHTHTHTHTPCVVDVEAISKFAQCEFRYGDAGRGGTMFESLVTSYPRRTDMWSVYVDMLVKSKQTSQARFVGQASLSRNGSRPWGTVC